MTEINGWHLPRGDGYFPKFIEGGPPKQNGFQREHLLKAFAYVKNWNVAIDVGAHVGFWTLDMAHRFDQVFAFEPSPDSFECLCKNMEEFPNVATARAAVGERSGECAMIDDPIRMANGKNVNTGSRYIDQNGKGVTMLSLDDLRFEGCGLLKIDVEGYEPAVVLGAQKLIKRFRPVIIMETDKKFGHRFGFKKFAAELSVLNMGYVEAKYHEPDGRNALRPDRIFVPD